MEVLQRHGFVLVYFIQHMDMYLFVLLNKTSLIALRLELLAVDGCFHAA